MKNLIRLNDYTKQDILAVFQIADDLQAGKYKDFLKGKTIVLFFPDTSIRTRVTFERGIYLLGGQSILFPPGSLDKKEKPEDVIRYLNHWVDGIVVRHKSIGLLDELSKYSEMTIINAMTDSNHPCEVLSDLYALSKIRDNLEQDQVLFLGANGNIGLAWKEASQVYGFPLRQCCPEGYEMEGAEVIRDLEAAVRGCDIVCTDSIPDKASLDFKGYTITSELMSLANEGAILNPCPPFYRQEEVSEEVIRSDYFVGYSFKKHLLEIQQAILIYNMTH